MRKLSGFSLMEMMVVLLIVAIVAAASAPMVSKKLSSASSAAGMGCLWKTHDDDKFSVTYNSVARSNKSVIIGAKKTDLDAGSSDKPRLFVKTNNDSNPHIRLYSNANGASAKADLAVTSKNTYWFSSADSSQAGPNSVAIGNEATVGSFTGAIAIGAEANALSGSVAIGSAYLTGSAQAKQMSVAVGSSSEAEINATAVGYDSKASDSGATAVGRTSIAEGSASSAFGNRSKASESYATAVGSNSKADGQYSSAFGYGSHAKSDSAIAIGGVAGGSSSIAIGAGAEASLSDTLALGSGAQAIGTSSLAFGAGATAEHAAQGGIAIGDETVAGNASATALGTYAQARGENSVALGHGAGASGSAHNSIAIGYDSDVSGASGIAIGNGASAQAGAVAIGSGVTSSTGRVTIGNSTQPVDISGCEIHDGVITASKLVVDELVVGGETISSGDGGVVIGNLDVTGYLSVNRNLYVSGTTRLESALNVHGDSLLGLDSGSVTYIRMNKNNGNPGDFYKIMRDADSRHVNIHPDEVYRCDRRLKNVGEVFTAGLEEIKKLEVFNYVYKKDSTKTPHVGVMAQDLMKIFPNAVFKGDDGFYRIRMEDMFYALVNAVKELDKKIDLLAEKQKKIDELEKRVDTLEKRLVKLEKLVKEK